MPIQGFDWSRRYPLQEKYFSVAEEIPWLFLVALDNHQTIRPQESGIVVESTQIPHV